MSHRFKGLRIFAVAFKVVAWVALLIGIIATVGVLLAGGTPGTPRGVSVVILVVSLLYFLIFFTVGEVIQLLLTIEEQTRKP